jgi:murein L,D-transpeptidase YcbB/YkuD
MATVNPMRLLLAATAIFLATSAFANKNNTVPPEAFHLQYQLLQQQLFQYQQVAKSGGWQKIISAKKFYMKGDASPVIKQIKKRLIASGHLESGDVSENFTDALMVAVKKVQRQFGYKENGVVDAQLIKALNVSLDHRLKQLQINMNRLSKVSNVTEGTWLVANIPEFKLHVYENGQHVFDIDIVVGTQSNKTVIFNNEMKQVVFSPYWNVPPSIIKEEILPAMRKNKNYLSANGYEQVGTEGGLPKIRQKPGNRNSLGLVKFLFPNSHNIYFHDTPAKSLFQLPKRTFSHGCIRLAEPKKLAEYLLRNNPEWTSDKIEKAMNGGKELAVNLSKPVPVSISYFTAWVDQEGVLSFREDVYGLDK